jgi:glycosyltransferase involved in cell wall biosynthesis
MKLTIAIPTYNRSSYLRRAVESLASQLPSIPDGAEVTLRILDNSSTDDTAAVCADLQKQTPLLELIRHPDNIGGDANILRCLEGGTGDYVWCFGDDDYILPGALASICRILTERDVSVLKLTSIEERETGSAKSDNVAARGAGPTDANVETNGPWPDSSIEKFESSDNILARFGVSLGNFSTMIYSTLFFKQHFEEPEASLFGSGYSQLEWVYRGLQPKPQCFAYAKTPAVVVRVEARPRGVSDSRIQIGFNILRDMLIACGYSTAVVHRFYSRQQDATLLGGVKGNKLAGKPSLGLALETWSKLRDSRFKLKLLVICAIPNFVYRWLWVRL